LLLLSPPILAFEQSTISVAITDMTEKHNSYVPGAESLLREWWDSQRPLLQAACHVLTAERKSFLSDVSKLPSRSGTNVTVESLTVF
jgi:hypothetical protein